MSLSYSYVVKLDNKYYYSAFAVSSWWWMIPGECATQFETLAAAQLALDMIKLREDVPMPIDTKGELRILRKTTIITEAYEDIEQGKPMISEATKVHNAEWLERN